MDRSTALRKLAAEHRSVSPGQRFAASFFEPQDAMGLARLFYAVYGDGYPIDTYYIPERLIEEHDRGNLKSVVARTPSGDVVAHCALYRSSAPNPHLFEYGLGLTLPEYRSTSAFYRVNQLLVNLVGRAGVDAIFGEAVCNHTTTQKLTALTQSTECAIEPNLMPADAYTVEQSAEGRVGCLGYCRVANDSRKPIYLPDVYSEEMRFILDGYSLDRDFRTPQSAMPQGDARLEISRYDFAGVARCHVGRPGTGIARELEESETSLRRDNFAIIQFFVDLGEPWTGALVGLLRERGYFFGGILPVWFGTDALLMQKHFVPPNFQGMKILSERGRAILEMARRDWESLAKERS